VRLFLNLSKEEQRRFFKRLDLPEKNWKFSAADVRERQRWDAYQQAFSEMLSAASISWAPWYVIPLARDDPDQPAAVRLGATVRQRASGAGTRQARRPEAEAGAARQALDLDGPCGPRR